MNRFVADLYAARALAARSGRRVELVLEVDPRTRCVTAYRVLTGRPPRTRREVALAARRRACACAATRGPSIHIDPRGLVLTGARTVRVERGRWADSVRISMLGRVLRF